MNKAEAFLKRLLESRLFVFNVNYGGEHHYSSTDASLVKFDLTVLVDSETARVLIEEFQKE